MSKQRSKQYKLSLTSSRKFLITIRNFRHPKAKRGKSFKQLVIPIYFTSIKEVAIRQQATKKAHRDKHTGVFVRPKRLPIFPILLVIIGLSGSMYYGWQIVSRPKLGTTKPFSLPAPSLVTPLMDAPKALPRSEPTRVRVPSVQIDYEVKQVGRQADGTMEVPPLFEEITGWYKYSPTPGEIGPAIIVGHVDTYKGPSVFWKLREIQPGAIIEVSRADGTVAKFKAEALKQFQQDNFPTQEVYGNITNAGLRLITCGGVFNKETGHYTENTVVFASIIQ